MRFQWTIEGFAAGDGYESFADAIQANGFACEGLRTPELPSMLVCRSETNTPPTCTGSLTGSHGAAKPHTQIPLDSAINDNREYQMCTPQAEQQSLTTTTDACTDPVGPSMVCLGRNLRFVQHRNVVSAVLDCWSSTHIGAETVVSRTV